MVASANSTWDTGATPLLLVSMCAAAWCKDNHMDEHSGVLTTNSGVGLLAGVVLLVLSEVALFVSILWALVLLLVAHSAYSSYME